jgi:type I restriction enzyme R subunit
MSKQALGSENVQAGILSALLGPGALWETLRTAGQTGQPAAA